MSDKAPQNAVFMINAQYIKDLSFENPGAPQSLVIKDKKPDISIDTDVAATKISDESFEVNLAIKCQAQTDNTPQFMIELVYSALVTLQGVPEEHIKPLLFIEVPRLLFPFARAVLSNTTREAGFPPLLIQPIDFGRLYADRTKATSTD